MKYSEKIGLSKEGKLDPNKVAAFFADVVGCVLTPVNNQYNSYWFSGMRNDDGSVYDLIDGPKYYKLVFDEYGVEIVCNGMINGFHMRMSLVDWIKEGSDKLKAQKKVA